MKHQNVLSTFLLSFMLLSSGALLAQQHEEQESKAGHSHDKVEVHGGEAVMTAAHHFEVVWVPDHVMVYVYDASQKPLPAKGVTGEVVFEFKDGKKENATLALREAGKMQMMGEHHTEGGEHDMMHGKMSKEETEAMHKLMSNQDHLTASIDLEGIKESDVKATFTLKGLPGKDESEATFTSKYRMRSMMQSKSGHEQHEQHH